MYGRQHTRLQAAARQRCSVSGSKNKDRASKMSKYGMYVRAGNKQQVQMRFESLRIRESDVMIPETHLPVADPVAREAFFTLNN